MREVTYVYTVEVEGEVFFFESIENAEKIASRYSTSWEYHDGDYIEGFDGDEEFFPND